MADRIAFDADAYQNLVRLLGGLSDGLKGAPVGDGRVQPDGQTWVLAQDLVDAGTRYFGGLAQWNADTVGLVGGLRDTVTQSETVLARGDEIATDTAQGG